MFTPARICGPLLALALCPTLSCAQFLKSNAESLNLVLGDSKAYMDATSSNMATVERYMNSLPRVAWRDPRGETGAFAFSHYQDKLRVGEIQYNRDKWGNTWGTHLSREKSVDYNDRFEHQVAKHRDSLTESLVLHSFLQDTTVSLVAPEASPKVLGLMALTLHFPSEHSVRIAQGQQERYQEESSYEIVNNTLCYSWRSARECLKFLHDASGQGYAEMQGGPNDGLILRLVYHGRGDVFKLKLADATRQQMADYNARTGRSQLNPAVMAPTAAQRDDVQQRRAGVAALILMLGAMSQSRSKQDAPREPTMQDYVCRQWSDDNRCVSFGP
jgi:hypothetical protein